MKKFILAIFGILFTSFLFSSNSFAVSDITYTFDGSTSTYQFCYASACDGYKYLILTPSSQNLSTNFYFSFTYQSPDPNYVTTTNNIYFSFLGAGVDYVYYLPQDSANRVKLDVVNVGNWTSGYSITATLTDTLPSGGGSTPTPEPEPCPDPEENSQYMNVVLDSFWKYQTAFAGAVVSIIVIFLVYRLIKGVLR